METFFKSRHARHRLVGDVRPEIDRIRSRFEIVKRVPPGDASYLRDALKIQRHQAQIVAFLLTLPSADFKRIATDIREPLTGVKPKIACGFFKRVLKEDVELRNNVAMHYIAPAARIGEPAFLERLLTGCFERSFSGFDAMTLLNAIMGCRDAGSGRILTQWVEAHPEAFLDGLNAGATEHKTNPKAPMAVMIAVNGEIPEQLRRRLSDVMGGHHEYAPLFNPGAHAAIARKAYAARWDLADFIGKPLREIRAADAAHATT